MLERVTIDKDLCDVRGLADFLLDIVRDHIFTLRQFEDVLFPVDNS